MTRLALWALLVACSSSTEKAPTKIMDGVRITYSADLDAALDYAATGTARYLRTQLGAMVEVRTPMAPLGAFTVVVADPARQAKTDAIIKGLGAVKRDCEAGDPVGAICMKIADEQWQAIRTTLLDEAATATLKRIKSIGLRATVFASGTGLIIDLPTTDQETLARARDVISRVGRLEIAAIDNGSEYMKSVFQQVEADTAAQASRLGPITAQTDQWRGAKGAIESDFYLVAHDREQLRRYLEELARLDPRFVVPADRRLAYEEIEAAPDRWSWRTHYLVRTSIVSGPKIQKAKAQRDGARIQIVIELDEDGAAALEALTAQSVGKKIAVMIDQRVTSAPIVAAPLGGGRLSITLGGPADRQQREADELVTVLRAGALPMPVREETVSELRGGKVIAPPAE